MRSSGEGRVAATCAGLVPWLAMLAFLLYVDHWASAQGFPEPFDARTVYWPELQLYLGALVAMFGLVGYWAIKRIIKRRSARQAQLDIAPELQSEGILAQWDFYRTLEGYCNHSIEENMASANPLVRSLSMLDARAGKRTLLTLSMTEEHPMVRYFHELRLKAEKQ